MLFSKWYFILLFLPITFVIYFWLNHKRYIVGGKVWLVVASLYFYAFWNTKYLLLILVSIVFNFAIGSWLARTHIANNSEFENNKTNKNINIGNRKSILVVGIFVNLQLLAYYKYTDFALENINMLFGTSFVLPHIILPLAISFFTFTQIAYLVDSFKGETAKYDLLNYALFVTFFPHLIAGPIVHHRQIMSQFSSPWTLAKRYPNILKALFIFAIGLFKKVVIADSFAVWADAGFDGGQVLGFYAAWATSLSYTFQLYFDFSGYCDMTVGASLLFNIWLPFNFNSPYKAINIQDFWRRWHITLSNFLRDYLYIPLGGNRNSDVQTYLNILITFILGGLWHGATWMFVIWGTLHGCALVVHRVWQKVAWKMPMAIAWLLTFLFVNFTWVFFRAKTLDDAMRLLRGMFDLSSAYGLSVQSTPTADLAWAGWLADWLLKVLPANLLGQVPTYLALLVTFYILSCKNSMQLAAEMRVAIGTKRLVFAGALMSIAMYFSLVSTSSVFLYFNF